MSGSDSSIQGHSIFLKDCGLIKAFRQIGDTHEPIIDSIMGRIRNRRGEKSITLRSVPRYTEDVLWHAEEVAEVYLRADASLAKLRKSVVIRLRGTEIANDLYLDSREISGTEGYVRALYVEVITKLVQDHGYTTGAEASRAIKARMQEELGFVHVDPLDSPLNEEERAEWDRQNKYYDALRRLEADRRPVINEAGFVFRPIRNADRQMYSIPEGLKAWIITRP